MSFVFSGIKGFGNDNHRLIQNHNCQVGHYWYSLTMPLQNHQHSFVDQHDFLDRYFSLRFNPNGNRRLIKKAENLKKKRLKELKYLYVYRDEKYVRQDLLPKLQSGNPVKLRLSDPRYFNDPSDSKFPDDYLFAFILNPTIEKRKQIESIARKLNLKVICSPDAASAFHDKFREIFRGMKIIDSLSIYNFIKAYQNAKYVVTDSFHGTCMCYIFNKPFSVYYNELRGVDRFVSLMNILKLDSRRIYEGMTEQEIFDQSNIGFVYFTAHFHFRIETGVSGMVNFCPVNIKQNRSRHAGIFAVRSRTAVKSG